MGYDLLIKNGRVCDGTGKPSFHGSVGVKDGKIVEIGDLSGHARRTIDAGGQVIAPGFIDIHTHYDAQISWDPLLECSGWHGVTSVLMGNCGVGVAPCRPGDKEVIAWDLVNVEAMPYEVLIDGVMWDKWESFPQYMKAIETRGIGLNAGFLLPLSSFRYYVMREAAAERAANSDEIAQMVRLFGEALDAGVCGFSLSLLPNHIGFHGRPLSSRLASKEELMALARVMREKGKGVIEIALHKNLGVMEDSDLDLLTSLARASGRPVTWIGIIVRSDAPEICRNMLAGISSVLKGSRLRPQVGARPIKLFNVLTLPSVFSPFDAWKKAFNRSVAEQRALYSDPAFREAFRKEIATSTFLFRGQWDNVNVAKVLKNHNQKYLNMSIADLAKATGRDPVDALLDLAVDEDLELGITVSLLNVNDDEVEALITHPNTILGLSDAGAHVDQHCEAGSTTHLLGKWVREKSAFTLEEAIRKITSDPAQFLSQPNKGVIAAGMDADLVVFDPDTVGVKPLEWLHDLPGGRPRLVERANGVAHTIVAGQPLYSDGTYQGGLNGSILRPALIG